MEEIITRFPHLGEQIFDQLNRKNLQKCRKVEESWKIFIDRQKFPWIRVIKKHLKLDKDWKEVVQRSNVEIVKNLASAVYDHYVGFDDGENNQETDSLDDKEDMAEDQGNLLQDIDNCSGAAKGRLISKANCTVFI